MSAPFTRVEEVELLRNAGADELYCGYVTEGLTKRWPSAFLILNRRGENDSFEKYKTFKKAVEQANNYNMPVFVTLNGLYTPEQYPLLIDLVKRVECLEGVKGIIIADLSFLLTLKKNNFKKEIHISTGGTCFNSSTVDFYKDLGVNRIVLDRQLTPYEIGNIASKIKSKIEIEIFIINVNCNFIDGFCNFFHCNENPMKHKIKNNFFSCYSYNVDQAPNGCVFYIRDILAKRNFKVYNISRYKRKNPALMVWPKEYGLQKVQRQVFIEKIFGTTNILTSERNFNFGCRICDLYELNKFPIKRLKIVGRGFSSEANIRSVKFVNKILTYLESNTVSKIDFQKKCKDLFAEVILNNKRRCTKFDCYFSSHWVRNEKHN